MKLRNLLFIFLSILQFQLSASNIDILTTDSWWKRYAGYISNVEIEITPDNHYARVDIAFYVNVDSINYNPNGYNYNLPNYSNQNLEAQLQFSMPKGSYFYDSYLWLNQSTIIRAALMSKGKATGIYDSIVNRKADPSILIKEFADNYSLKIFPISTTFRRKVMLSYAVPFIPNQSTKEYLELPSDLLKLLSSNSIINIKINKSQNLNFVSTLFPLNSKTISSTPDFTIVEIEKSKLESSKNYLEFESTSTEIISFYHHMTSAIEGFYDLRIKTNQLDNLTKKTSAYSVFIPFENNTGFVFNKQNNCSNYLLPTDYYYEAGEIYGKLQFNDSLLLSYKINDTIYTKKHVIKPTNTSKFIKQNWANLYSNVFVNEESMLYAQLYGVLNTQNAFLALENGDTVGSAKNNEIRSGNPSTGNVKNNSTANFDVFPSPFIDKFTVKSNELIHSIKLYTIDGREVYQLSIKKPIKEIEINTSDLNLENGIYFLIVETKSGIESIRIVKE